ncbi:MAG: hypothetical protein PHY22_01165 [Acholeplasmataceae bacterium]|nr:hypothetical protein [Acholeplasmataceae bacterium]MDD4090305.1 hypothetical protein [Acholeplasmataceae bacterium]
MKKILTIIVVSILTLILFSCDKEINLKAPIISVNEGQTISWKSINNASGYEVFLNGEIIKIKNNNYQLIDSGEYQIKVRSYQESGEELIYSNWSNLLELTFKKENQLAIPILVLFTESLLIWEEIENANIYELNVNGEIVITNNTYFNLTKAGLNVVKIKSVSAPNSIYRSREYSEALDFNVVEQEKLGAVILESTYLEVIYNDEFYLNSEVFPNNDNLVYDYEVSNDNLINVESNKFKAVELGTSYIKVKVANYLDAIIKINVIPKLEVESEITLNKGDTFKLNVIVEPLLKENEFIGYISDNEEVIKVTNDGYLYGVERGTSSILIITSNGGKLTINVTVR